MDNEDVSGDDGSFETVTDGDEQSLEQEPEELINQTTEKQNDTDTHDNSDERLVSEKHSEETISEHSVENEEAEKIEEESDTERTILVEKIQKALQDRKEMKKINHNLQAKLVVLFKTKKIDMSPYDKTAAELEKDYSRNLSDIAKLENQLANFETDFKKEVEDYEKILKDKEQVLQELTEEFVHLKRSVALRAVDSQSGKRMSPEEVDYYLKQEEKRDKMLREIRLEYVKQQNTLKEAEKHMEELNNLPYSVNVTEFDQLGVQIQTYCMKIDQRKEEIAKFQSRCSNTINILSHYKEKIHFIQHEKTVQEEELRQLEQIVKTLRDELFVLKAQQESTKAENHELQQKFKLLQNESLLDDYLVSKQKYNSLTEELENLKKRHSSAMACLSNKNKHSATKR